MSRTIINLTIALIEEEIDNALYSYSSDLYQRVFSIPDLRHQLIEYVFNSIPGLLILVEEDQEFSIQYNPLIQPLEKRLQIETVAHQGIRHILQKYLN